MTDRKKGRPSNANREGRPPRRGAGLACVASSRPTDVSPARSRGFDPMTQESSEVDLARPGDQHSCTRVPAAPRRACIHAPAAHRARPGGGSRRRPGYAGSLRSGLAGKELGVGRDSE